MRTLWFPTINPELCRRDLKCLNFCPYEVFEWERETGLPYVAHPARCLAGCVICLEGCDVGALTLPTGRQIRLRLKELRRGTTVPRP